jgi:hypothetical protein
MRTNGIIQLAEPEISRFPHEERPHMPGLRLRQVGRALALTPPSMLPSAILNTPAPGLLKFSQFHGWPMRRFAGTLAGASARLGADAVRYSFTVGDFHLLLFAGFDRRTRILEICAEGRLWVVGFGLSLLERPGGKPDI